MLWHAAIISGFQASRRADLSGQLLPYPPMRITADADRWADGEDALLGDGTGKRAPDQAGPTAPASKSLIGAGTLPGPKGVQKKLIILFCRPWHCPDSSRSLKQAAPAPEGDSAIDPAGRGSLR